MSQNFF
jgi:hypothetical protein